MAHNLRNFGDRGYKPCCFRERSDVEVGVGAREKDPPVLDSDSVVECPSSRSLLAHGAMLGRKPGFMQRAEALRRIPRPRAARAMSALAALMIAPTSCSGASVRAQTEGQALFSAERSLSSISHAWSSVWKAECRMRNGSVHDRMRFATSPAL